MKMLDKPCSTCKHVDIHPQYEPCRSCIEDNYINWKPRTQYDKLRHEMTVDSMAQWIIYPSSGRWYDGHGNMYKHPEQALAAEIDYLNSEVEEDDRA